MTGWSSNLRERVDGVHCRSDSLCVCSMRFMSLIVVVCLDINSVGVNGGARPRCQDQLSPVALSWLHVQAMRDDTTDSRCNPCTTRRSLASPAWIPLPRSSPFCGSRFFLIIFSHITEEVIAMDPTSPGLYSIFLTRSVTSVSTASSSIRLLVHVKSVLPYSS
jgi:hypothetical protein